MNTLVEIMYQDLAMPLKPRITYTFSLISFRGTYLKNTDL